MTGFGRRVNQRADARGARCVGEIVSFGVVQLLVLLGRDDEVVNVHAAQSGGIDHGRGGDGACLACRGVFDGDLPAGTAWCIRWAMRWEGGEADDVGAWRKDTAGVFEMAEQRDHEGVTVDDARGGGLETARLGADVGLARSHFTFAQPAHRHAVGERLGAVPIHALEGLALGVVLRDDPFARVAVGYVVGGAKVVEHFFAADAEVGLEGGGAVVDAGVDDLGVARRGFCAWVEVALEEEGGGGVFGEGAGGG